MDVRIKSSVLARMRAHAAAAYPREACGILLGEGRHIIAVRAAANVHPAPETRFEIDPQALIDAHRAARAGGAEVVGYYHSHPHGPPEPSATDRASAAGDGRVWAIVAPVVRGKDVMFWEDGGEGFTALSFTIGDG